MKERVTLNINKSGHLEIGGCDTVSLAAKYGTPLYVMDEEYIRGICKEYNAILHEDYGDGLICYASKAFSAEAIY